jgi:soluble lytic murein transglycosylase-like protein
MRWILYLAAFLALPVSSFACSRAELLNAIRQVESHGDPKAISSKGALGAYQFMPKTWAWIWNDLKHLPQYSDPALRVDASLSREAADAFLDWIETSLSKRGLASLDNTIAAYNCGVGCVCKNKGVPRIAETREYVRKVKGELQCHSTKP